MKCFAIRAVLGTFARLDYVLQPSVLTGGFAAGKVLHLAFLLCLLGGRRS